MDIEELYDKIFTTESENTELKQRMIKAHDAIQLAINLYACLEFRQETESHKTKRIGLQQSLKFACKNLTLDWDTDSR